MSIFASRTLVSLPLELQLQIISNLPYPDILALKLTSWHFHDLTRESLTVVSRVTWLLDRARASLPIPKSGKLRLHNDAVFLQNSEVQAMLRARRRHEECAYVWRELGAGEDWPGCLVLSGLRLCEEGTRLLESSGAQKPTWTMDGRLVYVSERMVRDWEQWRKRTRRPLGLELARRWDVMLLRLRLGWEVSGFERVCVWASLYAILAVMVVVFAVLLFSGRETMANQDDLSLNSMQPMDEAFS